MTVTNPTPYQIANAFAGLRELILEPNIEIITRKPDGTVDLRIVGDDGSYLAASIHVPNCLAANPQLRLLDIGAWYAPSSTVLYSVGDTEQDIRLCFLLIVLLDLCRPAVMNALGPTAHHAVWWKDVPAMRAQ